MTENKPLNLVVYAIHPIMYQTPIFRALQCRIDAERLPVAQTVLFGDDISLRPVYFEEIKTTFKPDTPTLLDGYEYVLMKNYARDSRAGFLSRINPGVFRELRERRADAVLVHGYESLTAWITVLAAKLAGARLIWRGEVTPRAPHPGLRDQLRRWLLRWYLSKFDGLMYSCEGNRVFLQDILGERLNRVPLHRIPCAVDNRFFQEEYDRLNPERATIRDRLGIGTDDVVSLICARLTTRKRPMDLLDALAKLDDPRQVALFVGDGPEMAGLKSRAAELGVRAVFAGFVNQSEIAQYYTAADIFAILSDYDPSPKALNEAMNFRLPVIVTEPVGTAYDLVDQCRNGFRVPVGAVSQISEAVRRISARPEHMQAMGQASARIVADWSIEADTDAILAAASSVTQRRLVPRGNSRGRPPCA
ncbi:Glycosyltransferase [Marinovum algicola DG 898]|nr:Glycosyltransferase [Marinovum algicola DG 898]